MIKATLTRLLVLALFLALGTAVRAEGEIVSKDGNGEEEQCAACEGSTNPECKCPAPDPVEKLPGMQVDNCAVGGPPDGSIDLDVCIEEEADTMYDATRTSTGLRIREQNGDELECIGMSEQRPEIGLIQLTHPDSSMVARVEKIVEDPLGPTATNPEAKVHVVVNMRTYTFPTTATMTGDDINAALASAIGADFWMFDYGAYWVIARDRVTNQSIGHVLVQADDEGLLSLDVELRRRETDPAMYDVECGAGL